MIWLKAALKLRLLVIDINFHEFTPLLSFLIADKAYSRKLSSIDRLRVFRISMRDIGKMYRVHTLMVVNANHTLLILEIHTGYQKCAI